MFCFSCKKEKQEEAIITSSKEKIKPEDSVLLRKDTSLKRIDFNKAPIDIKSVTLDDNRFWITSGVIDKKYLDTFCDYNHYHLKRGYNLSNKLDNSLITNFDVYVVDDEFKMSREKANEEIMSISTNDPSFIFWHNVHVGMPIDSIENMVYGYEYYKEPDVFKIYSRQYEGQFFYKNKTVDSINLKRRCSFKENNQKERLYHITMHEYNASKDTIVNFDFLASDETLDYSLDYKPFDKSIKSDTLRMYTANMEVVIVKSKFNKVNAVFTYDRDSLNIMTINGHNLIGADNIPSEYILDIYLSLNGTVTHIDKTYFEDLYEPYFDGSNAYYYDGEIIIEMNNSDGYLGYRVILFINRQNEIKRLVYIP